MRCGTVEGFLGVEYRVSSRGDQRPFLVISGAPWHQEARYVSDDRMAPVPDMPWPTLLNRERLARLLRVGARRHAVSLVVKAPRTRVHLVGTVPEDTALAVAGSLREVARPSTR